MPEYSLKHRTVILFSLLLILVGGLYSYVHMGKLEDPEFTIKTAVIVTAYPGASPHEVEQQVTEVIERAAQSADEVKKIRSISRAGISTVYVDLYERNRTDSIQQLWDMLRRKVAQCQGELPEGAHPSQVFDNYGDVYGIFLALTGDGFSNREIKKYADYIKRELLLVKDVSRITLFGDQTQRVDITLSKATVSQLGIHPGRIADALSGQNRVLPMGSVETENRTIRVSTPGDFKAVDEIGRLMIQGDKGEQFLLGDIAEISRSYVDPPEAMMRFNGKPAMGIAISTASGANVVTMGDAVQKRMDELLEDLPLGIELHGIYYQSKFVKGAIRGFMVNLMQSVAIVAGVLLVTMGIRSGILIASGLVFSILGTLVVMLVWGIDLQRISLAALILVMGMIVDNAIVVTDESLVALKRGKDRFSAMAGPATRTAFPLLGSTVIACLAFLPIYLSPNNAGEYCASLFQVVSIALMISWVLSMTQTPVLNHMLLKVKNKGGDNKDPFAGKSYRIYRKLLDISLKNRFLVLTLMVLLMVSAGVAFQKVPKMFFADSDKNQFLIEYWLPEGARIQKVSADLKKLENHLKDIPEINNFTSCIGSGGPRFLTSYTPEPPNPSYGQVIVNVHDYKTISGLTHELNGWMAENLPDAEPKIKVHISGPAADFKVEARFSGPDPMILRNLSMQTQRIMEKVPGAINIRDNWRQRVPVLAQAYSQKKGRSAGVERQDLASAITQSTYGVPVSSFREGDNIIPVHFRMKGTDESGFSGFSGTPVWGSAAQSVPMGQVVESEGIVWEDPVIRRTNRQRAITAQCDTSGITSDELLSRIRPAVEAIPLPPGYSLTWDGEYDLSSSSNEGVGKFLPMVLVLMAFILVLLFNGLRQPLIILMILPLSAIGIAYGLFITGKPFGFLAILGGYSLMGMLIKNAVVLMDQIDAEIRDGKEPVAAVMDSSVSRMRPVMMASGTTILGMIPLMSDVMFSSMAVTIMFGLAFATVLTLLVVPVLYTLFFRIKIS